MSNKFKQIKKLHIVTLVAGIIFVSIGIWHTHLWFDETYSVAIAKHSFSEIWNIGGHDVHPVLYYWVLRIISFIFPNSVLAYRIFSMLGIATLGVLGYTHIRKDFGEKTGLLFTFFSFFMAETANYANEIRMYSWGCTLITVCAIYAYRIYRGDSNVKNWAIFFLSSLCSIYMHYYGLMGAGIINLFLLIALIRNKRKNDTVKILILGVVQALAYLPWLVYLLNQMTAVSKNFWITLEWPKSFYEIFFCQMTGMIDRPMSALLIMLVYRELFVGAYKMKKEGGDLLPAKMSYGVFGTVIIAALIMTIIMHQPVLFYRYLFILVGLFIFTVSYILAKLDNKRVTAFVCSIVAVLAIINNVYLVTSNYDPKNGDLVDYLNENIQPEDQIIYEDILFAMVATDVNNSNQIFYNEENWGVEEAYKSYAPKMETHVERDFLDEEYERIWILDDGELSTYNKLFGNNSKYEIVSTEIIPPERYSEVSATVVCIEKTE